MYSRCSWLGECVVVTACCVVCVIEYGWYVGRGDCVRLKLIYMMMLLQGAMIVKSLPNYMYMYCPALSSSICLPIKMLRNAITKDKGMYGSF